MPQKAKVLWFSANYLRPYNRRDGIKPLKIDPLPIGSIYGIKPAVTELLLFTFAIKPLAQDMFRLSYKPTYYWIQYGPLSLTPAIVGINTLELR